MRKMNKKLILVLCLTLILTMIFALSACDKKEGEEGNSENKGEPLSAEDCLTAINNAKIHEDGVHDFQYAFPQRVNKATLNGEKAIHYKDLYEEAFIYKNEAGEYMQLLGDEFSGYYSKLTKAEYEKAFSEYSIEKYINASIQRVAKEDLEVKEILKDLYNYKIEGFKSDNKYCITTTSSRVIKTEYSGMLVPCEEIVSIQIDELGYVDSIIFDTHYVEGYKPSNMKDNKIDFLSGNYQWLEPQTITIPDFNGDKFFDDTLNGEVIIHIADGNTFADGSSIKSVKNGDVVDLGIPKHKGFEDSEFLGWYKDRSLENKIDENGFEIGYQTTGEYVYPKWKQKDNVNIYLDGALDYDDNSIDTTQFVTYFDLAYANLYKEGYNLEGWYTTQDFAAESEIQIQGVAYEELFKPIPSGSNIYAKFVAEQAPGAVYTVTFKPGDVGYNALDVPVKVKEGALLFDTRNIPAFVKEGQAVVGWYKDEQLTQEWDMTTPVTADMTLYPKYGDAIKVVYNYCAMEVNNIEWIMLPTTFTVDEIIDAAETAGPNETCILKDQIVEGLYLDEQYTKSLYELTEIPSDKILNLYVRHVRADEAYD